MKVLVVEDDPGTRSALGKLLRRAGATVVTTGDGSDGLQRLLEDHFDVLLTDLHMPKAELDGFALIEQTHRLPLAHRPRRVVAISGEYNRNVLRGQSGVDFIAKPIDLNQLLDTIGGVAH
jgi:CheY-like chemotaxis protein